jgi:hypothetical protein
MIDQNVWIFIDFEIFQSTTKLARHSDMKQTNANSMRLSTLKKQSATQAGLLWTQEHSYFSMPKHHTGTSHNNIV